MASAARELRGAAEALCRDPRGYLIAFLLIAGQASCATTTGGLARAIAVAAEEGRPIPLVTERVPDLSRDEAYAIQRAVVKRALKHDSIAGFKAAATSPAARERLAADEPVFGVLLESGRVSSGGEVALEGHGMLLVEAELGYRFREPIATPPADLTELRALVAEIVMVVELPDGGFDPTRAPNLNDLIAANTAAASFVEGPVIPLDAALPELTVTLDRDGQLVGRGRPSDTLGDPWEALAWTVAAALERGYVIEPEHLVITGAIGGMAPGRSGSYRAAYGSLGEVRFTVR